MKLNVIGLDIVNDKWIFQLLNGNGLLLQLSGEMDLQSVDSVHESVKLPQTFAVKYLGKRQARGLWGIKYTRKPVDDMVNMAKSLPPGQSLPFVNFRIDNNGVTVSDRADNHNKDFETGFYPVDIISYGVQVSITVHFNLQFTLEIK